MKNTDDNYSNLSTGDISLLEIIQQLKSFLIQSYKLLIISFVVSTVWGFAYFKLSKPSYEATLTAYANHYSDVRVRDMIKYLNKMLEERDIDQLAQSLQINKTTAQKINNFSISINPEINRDKDEKEAKLGNTFSITVSVSSNSVLDTLQQALNNYLGNNPYVKKLEQLDHQKLTQQIGKIDEEIAYLDSLQHDIRLQVRKGGNIQILDPSSISSRLVELSDRRNDLKNSLVLREQELVVIAPFVPFKKQASPRLIISVVTSSVIGLIFGVLAAIVFAIKRNN